MSSDKKRDKGYCVNIEAARPYFRVGVLGRLSGPAHDDKCDNRPLCFTSGDLQIVRSIAHNFVSNQKRILLQFSFIICMTVNYHFDFFQQKYFDSGDYAMAKAKTGGLPGPGMKAPVVPGKGKFLPPGSTTGEFYQQWII